MRQKTDVQTVSSVVKMGLCTGCGTCVSLCPSKAIAMRIDAKLGVFLPEIDSSKCSGCSVCFRVCPGFSVNFRELSKKVSPEPAKPNSVLLGNYLNCYVGYSNDYDIRFDSSSGGIVTQLLVFALEEGLIDGALVTRMRKDRPLEPESFIARTREEILEASKSKYCPVPANVALREIMDHDGRYAVVGLPCHIHGLRKAQGTNAKLRKRVVMAIGIMCSHNDSFYSTRYVLHRFGINPTNVARISYRGQGWPGLFRIEQKSGGIIDIPLDKWIRIHEYCFFTPDRCLVCCDHTAELSDVSCGDAWLSEYSSDEIGSSIIISRNKTSESLIARMISSNKIHAFTVDSSKIMKSQGNVRFKKNSFVVRRFLFKITRKNVPSYVIFLPKTRFVDWVRSAIIFVNRRMAKEPFFYENIEKLINLQVKLKKLYMGAISK